MVQFLSIIFFLGFLQFLLFFLKVPVFYVTVYNKQSKFEILCLYWLPYVTWFCIVLP